MKIILGNNLLNEVLKDLKRSHPFAFERVGYLLGTFEKDNLIFDEWMSISDELYEDNSEVGARIGREGMIMLMKAAFSKNKVFFHTHIHDFQNTPNFSFTDEKSLLDVTGGLIGITGRTHHGGVVIGQEFSRVKYWTDRNCKKSNELLLPCGVRTKDNK